MKRDQDQSIAAFTLLELLVVVAIMAIILAFAVPAVNGILRGRGLTEAAEAVRGQLALARQTALAGNRSIQVRFYELPGEAEPAPAFRALQLVDVTEGATPISAVTRLPTGAVLNNSDAFSTLLTQDVSRRSGKVDLPGHAGTPYIGVTYLPDGSTDLPFSGTPDGRHWCATIVRSTQATNGSELPANFATLQIQPVTGHLTVHRP